MTTGCRVGALWLAAHAFNYACSSGGSGSGGPPSGPVIGPGGGVVSLPNGPTLQFPPGAVRSDIHVTVERSPTPAPATALSPVYRFGPSGTTFSMPVSVSIPMTPGTGAVSIYWTKFGQPGRYDSLPATLNGSTATALVLHFSDGFVGPECTEGAACPYSNPCHLGSLACAGGTPACSDSGTAVADATPCGTEKVCSAGECVTPTCSPGQPCQPSNPCTLGTTSCAFPVSPPSCEVTGVKPDYTDCGAAKVCSGGACIDAQCVPGADCQPENPCSDGTVACVSPTKPGTCASTGSKPNGTSCGTGVVCSTGTCVAACEQNRPCQPANACWNGATACDSTWSAPLCAGTSSKPDGTSCGTGQACLSGTCVAAVKPVIASFAATPSTVGPGGTAVLSWNVSGAEALAIDQGVGAVAGTTRVVTPGATTTYTLTATNFAGAATATATVTVLPIPAIASFTATPPAITPGSSSVLAWDVTGADTLVVDQGVGAVTGATRAVTPAATTTYTLTAANAVGSASYQATVIVQPLPAITSFTTSPSNIAPGGSSTLTWSVTDADTVTIDQGIGTVTGTTRTVEPSSTKTYTLTASNAVGTAQEAATVTVSTVSKVYLDDATVVAGGTVTLTAEVTVGAGSPSLDLDWVVEAGSLGSVSPSRGVTTRYTAPAAPGTHKVWGTSAWDPSRKDYCRVTVTPPPDTWRYRAPMSTPRARHTATLLSSGQVLVVGGWGPAGPLDSAELYDPSTDQWSSVASMGEARHGHTATLLPSGKVLVVGGYNLVRQASAEVYDPSTNSWTPTGPRLLARVDHTATLLPSGKVLIVGGYADDTLAEPYLYDPLTETTTAQAGMALDREHHTATLLSTGKLLVAGGTVDLSSYASTATSELYDPDAGDWLGTGPLHESRTLHSATSLVSGKVLVVGGWVGGNYQVPYGEPELYDPATQLWSETGLMPVGVTFHTATLLPSGQVLVSGGKIGSGNDESVLATAYLFDALAETWSPATAPNTLRRNHSATLLPTGEVLVVGGETWLEGAVALVPLAATVEGYTPP